MEIRLVKPSDSKFLLDIYKQYIDSDITFEYILPAQAEFQERIEKIYKTYPYIVCTENKRPIAYAYAHRYKERAAYEWSAEISVYIDKNFTSKGLGTILIKIIIEILKLQGVKNIYSYVTGSNIKSKNLHLKSGFKSVGIYRNAGFKNGRWIDIEAFEMAVGEYEIPPKKMIPITQLSKTQIQNLFLQNNLP